MADILTTLGVVDEATLDRTVGFEDRPTEFVIWVEWRFAGELVKRDAHLVLKQPSVVADAIAGRDVTVGISGTSATSEAGAFG